MDRVAFAVAEGFLGGDRGRDGVRLQRHREDGLIETL